MTIKIPKKFFNFKSLLLTFKMSTIIKLNAKCKSLAAAHWYLFFSVAMKAVNTSVTHLTSLRVPHVVCVTSGPCLRLWASLWVSVPGPGDHGDPGRREVRSASQWVFVVRSLISAGTIQIKQALRNSCELLRQWKELHTSSWNCMQAHGTSSKLRELHASLCITQCNII